jgi:two-component system, NtrC family, sensor kinase
VLEFEDNGCGIPRAAVGHIFEPFFTTKAVGEGTGLGLSISYGIIEKHGGTIDVRSVEGQGTCFTVRLPLTSEPAASTRSTASAATA